MGVASGGVKSSQVRDLYLKVRTWDMGRRMGIRDDVFGISLTTHPFFDFGLPGVPPTSAAAVKRRQINICISDCAFGI